MKVSNKLNASSLDCVFYHYQDNPFVIVSATNENDSDFDRKMNILKLRSRIREKSLPFIPVEDSYIIQAGHMSSANLFNFAIEICIEFNQSYFLFSDGEGTIGNYDQEGNPIDNTAIVFNNKTFLENNDINLIHYRSVNWGTYLRNRYYSKLVKLEEAKTEIEMFDRIIEANLREFYKSELNHIINLLFDESIDFGEMGVLRFEDQTYEYTTIGLKDGWIRISKLSK